MFENLGMRRSSTVILLIPLAFIVGAIASESLAFAAKETMGKPFLEIWDAMPKIYTIENSVTVPAMRGYSEELTCKSGYIIIGTDFDTNIDIFTTDIDIKNQKFTVSVFNNDKFPKELRMTLTCHGL